MCLKFTREVFQADAASRGEYQRDFDQLLQNQLVALPDDQDASGKHVKAALSACKTPAMNTLKKLFMGWQKESDTLVTLLEESTADNAAINLEEEDAGCPAEVFLMEVNAESTSIRIISTAAMAYQAQYGPVDGADAEAKDKHA